MYSAVSCHANGVGNPCWVLSSGRVPQSQDFHLGSDAGLAFLEGSDP